MIIVMTREKYLFHMTSQEPALTSLDKRPEWKHSGPRVKNWVSGGGSSKSLLDPNLNFAKILYEDIITYVKKKKRKKILNILTFSFD